MKNTIERTPSKARTARKSATPEKTTVELDAVLVAKIRASLRAVGRNTDIGEYIGESMEADLDNNSGFFESWIEDETTPQGREIESKLERIRNGDKRLVGPELPTQAGKLPIMFPADSVKLLEELLEASGTCLSLTEYAEKFLQQEIWASLDRGFGAGVPEFLDATYELDPKGKAAMQDVIDRWNAKESGA